MQITNTRAMERTGRPVGSRSLRPVLAVLTLASAACSDASRVSSPDLPRAAALGKGPKGLATRGPLLFSATITGDRELYTVNEDGTNLKRLTFSAGADDLAAFSPDGSKIAFVSERSGRNQIYVMNSDGSGVKPITNFADDFDVAGAPAWSPDGKKIAVGLTDHTGPAPRSDIYLMSANGAGRTRLTSQGTSNAEPTFSPDGKTIAFHSDHEAVTDELDIWTMAVDGTNHERITDCDIAPGCRRPEWSPDGNLIAYEQASPSFESVAVMQVATKAMVLLTSGGVSDPFWAPDGVKFAMVYTDGLTRQLRTLNTNGGALGTVIELSATPIHGLSWGR
jgi:Tol biopolymer transport system component